MFIALLSTLTIIIIGFTSGTILRKQFPHNNVLLSTWSPDLPCRAHFQFPYY